MPSTEATLTMKIIRYLNSTIVTCFNLLLRMNSGLQIMKQLFYILEHIFIAFRYLQFVNEIDISIEITTHRFKIDSSCCLNVLWGTKFILTIYYDNG